MHPVCCIILLFAGLNAGRFFKDDFDRENFLERLSTLIPQTQSICYAWVIMSNHAPFLRRRADFRRQWFCELSFGWSQWEIRSVLWDKKPGLHPWKGGKAGDGNIRRWKGCDLFQGTVQDSSGSKKSAVLLNLARVGPRGHRISKTG